MSATRSLRYGLLGLLQGALIWALLQVDVISAGTLPAAARGALLALVGLGPLLAYQSAASTWPPRWRSGLVAALCLWLTATAYWQGISAVAGTAFLPRLDAPALFGLALLPPVALALALGWDGRQRGFDYARLFETAWRNGLLLALSGLLLGLFWATLWAGAWLLDSIGIRAVRELISKGGFAWPVSAAVYGLAFAQGLARASAVAALRRFWLGLNAWFYPLALGFGVAWVAALPFTGLDALFATRHAAFMLLWFAVLSVKFCNAAWQDGKDAPAYPGWLRAPLPWAQLSLLVVAVVAGWALYARIAQHGLSADRIWALYVTLLMTLYAAGYALSVLPRWRRRGWLASVAATNIATAGVGLLLAALLLSPLLDARELAVRQQLSRLESGDLPLKELDFDALAHEHGRAGRKAVQALAQGKGSERAIAIATLAQTALNAPRRGHAPSPASPDALAKLRLWPRDMPLDPAFAALLTSEHAKWGEAECLRLAPRCLLWRVDLDGDGLPEVLMLQGRQNDSLGVYRQQDGRWRHAGYYNLRRNESFERLAERIESGGVSTQPARLSDLVIDGKATGFVATGN